MAASVKALMVKSRPLGNLLKSPHSRKNVTEIFGMLPHRGHPRRGWSWRRFYLGRKNQAEIEGTGGSVIASGNGPRRIRRLPEVIPIGVVAGQAAAFATLLARTCCFSATSAANESGLNLT